MSSASPELPAAFLRAPLAHRGLHDRAAGIVENSRAAVRAAVAAGYGIEIDIQAAGCGEAMVFHDAKLKRLTGRRGLVANHSAAELGTFELTGGSETIPTLAEILAIIAGRAPLLIELKDADAMLGPTAGTLEARTAELLADYDGPAALMSFNPHSVAALARTAPGRPRGLTTCNFEGPEWPLSDTRRGELAGFKDFGTTGSVFVSHNHRELDSPAIAALRTRGVPVLCWTVRKPAEEARARRVADNITFEGYIPDRPG